jgi:hypothetical protein
MLVSIALIAGCGGPTGPTRPNGLALKPGTRPVELGAGVTLTLPEGWTRDAQPPQGIAGRASWLVDGFECASVSLAVRPGDGQPLAQFFDRAISSMEEHQRDIEVSGRGRFQAGPVAGYNYHYAITQPQGTELGWRFFFERSGNVYELAFRLTKECLAQGPDPSKAIAQIAGTLSVK